MIATDIDGTMLWSDGTLSARTRQALHQAHEAGIEVVPATGRPMVVTGDVIEAAGLTGHWIFANGAITRHIGDSRTVRAYWIEPEPARELIVQVRERLEGARFALEFEIDIAYEPGFELLVPNKPPLDPIDDVLESLTQRVQKVLVFHPNLGIESLFGAVQTVLGGNGIVSYSGFGFVEVAPKLVTKAMALSNLCDDLGIDAADVAAFGDNHNDVAMLKWAGHSFAMANASDDAKEAAGEVILHSDNDGLAVKIEEITAAVRAGRAR